MKIKSHPLKGKNRFEIKTHEDQHMCVINGSHYENEAQVGLVVDIDKRSYTMYLNEHEVESMIKRLQEKLKEAKIMAEMNRKIEAVRQEFQGEQEISA